MPEISTNWIAYEQPLNERLRSFLRLEFLFGRHRHHRADESVWGVRATLQSLLDILTLLGRSDFKSELLKELLEQHNLLSKLASRSDVNPERLTKTLKEIDEAVNGLQTIGSHFVSGALRDNEFLIAVLNRTSIPGGTCSFDVPILHHWLSQPYEAIKRDLDAWFADLRAFERAINLYLKLLRAGTEPTEERAPAGMFVYSPQGTFTLLRVLVPAQLHVYPEISAGRHRFSIRFMSGRDVNMRPSQAATDITFKLHCCVL